MSDEPDERLEARRKHRRALDDLQDAIRQTEGTGKGSHRRVARASRREQKAREDEDPARGDAA